MAMNVETLNTTYIKPQKPIGPKVIQLTIFDILCVYYKYMQLLMIFKCSDRFNVVEERLKNGLRVVLEDYFPLAGKLETDEDGILRVRYDDDMVGVELKISYAHDIEVDDIVSESNMDDQLREFFPYNGVYNFQGLCRPLLAVQLTKLKDGFVLGCAFNHAIIDGTSMWHFLEAWADICIGSTRILTKPFHDRTMARNTRIKIDLPLNPLIPEIPMSSGGPLIRQRVFSFSELTIYKIKSNYNKNEKIFSTFLCMVTHVWRAVTRARQLRPEEITRSVMFVNSRSRIDPPMPKSYFGNIVTSVNTVTTAQALYTDPLDTPASMLKQALEKHDSNAIEKDVIEWEKSAKPQMELPPNFVAFGSSPKFKIYDLDFGWGKPELVRNGLNNTADGMVYFFQGKNRDGSVDIDIGLEDNAMKRLERDKEFLHEPLARL